MVFVFSVHRVADAVLPFPATGIGDPRDGRSPVVPAPHLLAEISSQGRHVPYLWRSHGLGSFGKERVPIPDEFRPRYFMDPGQRADLHTPGIFSDATQPFQ